MKSPGKIRCGSTVGLALQPPIELVLLLANRPQGRLAKLPLEGQPQLEALVINFQAVTSLSHDRPPNLARLKISDTSC